MTSILKMPRLGETMDEGQLVAWLVEFGAPFKRGDPIMEVETDKTLVEYPALGDGVLVESLVEVGETIEVGASIAKIDVGSGPDWTSDGSDDETTSAEPPVSEPAGPEPAQPAEHKTKPAATAATKTHGERKRATPVARRMAKQANIDLAGVVGTGRRGRVEREDIEAVSLTPAADLQKGYGIAWAEKGVSSGAPIVFIHGFAADHSAWAGLQSQMARAGHRTVALDLPSHGSSAQDAHDISELSLPVIELLNQKFDTQPIHIVSHSMGSLVAVDLAQALPIASLTLIAPAGVGRTINTHFIDALAKPRDVSSVARVLSSLTHGPNGLSDDAHNAIFDTLAKGRIADLAQNLAGASGQNADVREQLALIAQQVPVSLLLGHRDQIINWSEALDISPLVSVHHFPDVGHMPHWEALPLVQSILERKIAL